MLLSGPIRGALVALVVSVPTLAAEEAWGGRPMIDQPGLWWMVPGAVVLAAFFVAGIVAGRGRPRRGSTAAGAGILAVVTLVVADVIRRLVVVGESLSWPVAVLWVYGGLAAVAVAAVGGWAAGRRRVGPRPAGRRRRA
jgi:hypothetical protein